MPLSTCKRCAGTGIVRYQYGRSETPVTDIGASGYRDKGPITWGPVKEVECVKCFGTGWGKPEYLPNAGMKVVFDERGRPHRTKLGEANATADNRADEPGSQTWP